MKKYFQKASATLLLLALLSVPFACDDFVEKKLEDKTVTIIAPADSTTLSTATVSFWWDKVEGASAYNLQVVSPSFGKVQRLWADSVVTDNKLVLSLVPGKFEWRIKAVNGSSETIFTTAAFAIDSTQDLINESVILISPVDGAATNKLQQTFRWSNLYNAANYNFKIANPAGEFIEDVITDKAEASYEFSTDGIYTWTVRAQNEISNTLYTSFTLQIDTQKPEVPVISTPYNHETVAAGKVPFSWTRANDTGSPLYDSLCVFADEALTDRKLAKKLDQTSYEETFEAGTYYWYVKSCDAAGNNGERSAVYTFTTN